MPDIVLTTFNARFAHTAFGLRYLLANLGELAERACLREFGLQDRSLDVVAELLACQPRIIGFGVYIWNVAQTLQVVADLRCIAPEVIIVLGGPEVSYEIEEQPLAQLADYILPGEADLTFADLCRQLLAGQAPSDKILSAPIPDLKQVRLPYHLYSATDIAQRVIYVEASRGCPFTCEFCLSALEIPVRAFPLTDFLHQLEDLLQRGARQFKFVDRTFNLNLRISQAILEFFLERYQPGLFLHFEMIPDRLPDSLRNLLARFPPGALQLEIGIQTFNPEVGQLISRPQNNDLVDENLQWLRRHSGVHLHADLIVGLPGETLDSFASGFDRLVGLRPHEIQVGILKRLRGTPICRHDDAWQMIYSPNPPYELLCNRLLDFAVMQRLRRFARYWDLVANSGNFTQTHPLLWQGGASPFWSFLNFSDWLFSREQRTHGIPLKLLAERLFEYLTRQFPDQQGELAQALWTDYTRHGREDRPAFLKPFELSAPRRMVTDKAALPRRQSRHLAGDQD